MEVVNRLCVLDCGVVAGRKEMVAGHKRWATVLLKTCLYLDVLRAVMMVVADRNILWQMLHSSYESPDLLRLSSKLFFICKVNITRAVT